MARSGTATSSFGVSSRSNHDSTRFYESKLYKGRMPKENFKGTTKDEPVEENEVPAKHLNKVFCSSSESMKELPDNSIHLMVTSPPYNVGKEYDQDLSLEEYNDLLRRVMKETYRVLVPGGRACINIANVGRRPYIPLHAGIIRIMAELGFLMRGEVVWEKGSSAGTSTAWGSWKSAKNPILRDTHEYILIFSKASFSRQRKGKDTITKEEFLEYTKSVWRFPAASAKKLGHAAPFPEELPARCLKLYTFEGDVVLDPFMGSGQSALAAIRNGRKFVGYDIDKRYCQLAQERMNELLQQTPG
jgi:modification methylase